MTVFHSVSINFMAVYWMCLCNAMGHGPSVKNITQSLFTLFQGRYWEMVERLKITHFYTAPTAIRMLIKCGEEWVHKYDRSALRILGCGKLLNFIYYQFVPWIHCPPDEIVCEQCMRTGALVCIMLMMLYIFLI